MHTGCTRPAGSSRLASRKPPPMACARGSMVIVRSDRGYNPGGLPLAACSNAPGASCISADARVPGLPWARSSRGSIVESRSQIARLFKAMCRRDVATRQLAADMPAVAQPLQGPVRSARSCVPFVCERSPISGADPSSGRRAHVLLRDACGRDDSRGRIRNALLWLACPCFFLGKYFSRSVPNP
jgi:hypothetical protein